MTSSNTSFSLDDLLCQENPSSLYESVEQEDEEKQEEEEEEEEEEGCINCESEDEYMQLLIQKESRFRPNSCLSAGVCSAQTQSESWLKWDRLDTIEWVLNTRALFGFQFTTAFLSLTYFDRYLSTASIDVRHTISPGIQLLSAACLSLAAKMEECKAPALSLYRFENCNFGSEALHRMELQVLSTLQWRIGSITPFAYLQHFVNKFCLQYRDSGPEGLVSAATQLVFALTKEVNLLEFRPSVMAAAAVLAASDDQLTRKTMEIKMGVIPSWEFLDTEDIFSCYSLMLEIKMRKSKTPMSEALSSSSSALENSSITSTVGTKRKLTFL